MKSEVFSSLAELLEDESKREDRLDALQRVIAAWRRNATVYIVTQEEPEVAADAVEEDAAEMKPAEMMTPEIVDELFDEDCLRQAGIELAHLESGLISWTLM
ncbi:hypothetical protein CAPTEDRAFT_213511, partial [Capitella teleta]